jgi:hypothetical protein
MHEKSVGVKVVVTGIPFLLIGINIAIFVYLNIIAKEDECIKCNIKKNYLNGLIRGALVYNAIFVLLSMFLKAYKTVLNIPKVVMLLASLLYIISNGIFVIGLYIYYQKLVESNCLCIYDSIFLLTTHKFVGVWRVLLLFVYVISLLVFLINIFYYIYKNKKQTVKSIKNVSKQLLNKPKQLYNLSKKKITKSSKQLFRTNKVAKKHAK